MTRSTRIAVVLGAVAASLAVAGSALAAYTSPRLFVTDNRNGAVTIDYTQTNADDPTAKLTIYVPTGYAPALAQPAGTTIGTVTALGTAADLGGALLPLSGTVQVRAASGTYSSGGQQVPLSAAATQCTGSAAHTAFWVLILQAAGQTLELPVSVDSVTTAPTSTFASATIQVCLPPPDVPAGTPGRATFGFKLTRAALTLRDVFPSVGNGIFRWRTTATPYTPGQGKPNPAGTVEIQSLVAWPRGATVRAPKLVAKRRGVATFRVTGTLRLAAGESATSIRLFRGRTRAVLGSTSTALRLRGTALSGTFRIRQTKRARTFWVQVRASVPRTDFGASRCEATFSPVPCISATRAAYFARSASARFVVPKR